MTAKIHKNPETSKRFRIFVMTMWYMLPNHDLFTIPDIETLARLGDTLALEGVPFSLAFGEGWGEVLDARRAITIIVEASEADRQLDHLRLLKDKAVR